MLHFSPPPCNGCRLDPPNNLRAADPPDYLTAESNVSDSLLSALRESAWAGYDGSPVLPSTEVEAALAAALDPRAWRGVSRG